MELRVLHYFLTIAREGSLIGAAKALSRSDKQFLAEFVFEFLHLPGERRLRACCSPPKD